jgi:hypothetical protein
LIQETFGALDPRDAQHALPVEEYAAIRAKLKPYFIHHPKSKQHFQSVLSEIGCDVDKTYFDVPKMRSSTSGGISPQDLRMPGIPIETPGTPRPIAN